MTLLVLAGCVGLNSYSGSDLVLEGNLPESGLFHAESTDNGDNGLARALNRTLRIDNLYGGADFVLRVVRADTADLSRNVGFAFVSLECSVDLDIDVLDDSSRRVAHVSGSVKIRESRLKTAVESADRQLDLWEEGIMDKAAAGFVEEVLY